MIEELKAKDLVTQNFKELSINSTLSDALKLFSKDTEVLVVKNEEGSAKGILTEWMILKSGLNRKETKVKRVMKPFPKININDSLERIIRLMIENNIYQLPVVEENKVIGIISDVEIIRHVLEDSLANKKIKDLPKGERIYISKDETIGKLLSLFKEFQIERVPVVDKGKVVGVIGVKDVLIKLFKVKERPEYGTLIDEKPSIFDTKVEAIMDVSIPYVLESSPLREAINQMLDKGVDIVVAVDKSGKLHDLITRTDILSIIYERICTKKQEITVQISSKEKIDEFEKKEIIEAVERFINKYSESLGETRVYIYLKQYKQKWRSKNLIYSKIRINSEIGSMHARGKGFGVESSVKNCLENLERELFSKVKRFKDKSLTSSEIKKWLSSLELEE